jgi:hypothetical protein
MDRRSRNAFGDTQTAMMKIIAGNRYFITPQKYA